MKISDVKTKAEKFREYLKHEQKSKSTIKAYSRATAIFINFAERENIKRFDTDVLMHFKEDLINSLSSASSNTYIVGFNAFLSFIKYNGVRLKCIKRQSKDYVAFPLTEGEYKMIMSTAQSMGGDNYALFKTLAGSGVRVSELRYITVEAVRNGYVEINNKGKTRGLVLSDNLCQYLLEYSEHNNISTGIIFTGRDGKSALSTSAVWRKINRLKDKTGIDGKKLHPHNLRHFYASKFMKIVNDLIVLKDLLGHSDIKTTTIYLHPDGDYIKKCVNKIVA